MATYGTRSIEAGKLKPGMWLAYSNPRQNQRVVDTAYTRDGQIKVYADYGNGGEPATLFFEEHESVLVVA